MAGRYPPSLRDELYRLSIGNNIVEPQGVYKRPALRVAPFYEQYGLQFTWDIPYSAWAAAIVGREHVLARGFVQNMLDQAVTDGPDAGMVPRSVTAAGDQAGQDGSQTPHLAWLSWELHGLGSIADHEFLADVYPKLAASIDWWQGPRRDFDGDGLSEFAGSTATFVAYESGHDFSPERDLVMGEPTAPSSDGLVHEPIADVFLNASLYAELDALSRIAGALDDARVGEWSERRDALKARMTEAMWCEEVGGFFPVVRRDLCPSQPRVYRHTPALLQPLWAGLATQEQADRTVATIKQRPRQYPWHDHVMWVRLDPSLYRGYQVVTDGLHPTRGVGAAAGGVELTSDGFVASFDADRGPAVAAFGGLAVGVTIESVATLAAGARVVVEVEDGAGRVIKAIDAAVDGPGVIAQSDDDPFYEEGGRGWVPGIRRLRLRTVGCVISEVELRYKRMARTGLLSPFGIKSAHPLDGKHPAPGAPTQFWSGTIWGPHNFHGPHGLRRYGHDALARAVARAYCDAVATSYAAGGEAFEHLSHETGQGCAIVDYTWTAAVALVLMADFIDDDI